MLLLRGACWGRSSISPCLPQLPFDFTWKMLKDKFNECGKCLPRALWGLPCVVASESGACG